MTNESLPTPNVELPEPSATASKKPEPPKKNRPGRPKRKKDNRFLLFLRGLKSELKKVTWARFKSTKNEKGALAQTGTVLFIVVLFIVVITAMDIGLSALLKTLIKSGS